MKRTRIAAFALASALLALPASAEWIESEWWNVDFTDQEPGQYDTAPRPSNHPTGGGGMMEYGGVEFEQGSLNGVTNVSREVNGAWVDHQPYASGTWKADAADESHITNGVVTNIVGGVTNEWDLGNYLELSTQGNELTWTPSNGVAKGRVNLVDARLRLVGSDSEPEVADFDPTGATHRVQAAVYLKNETDPDTNETTNSVLCVYSWDNSLNGGNGGNVWVALKAKNGDLEIEDGSWHRVQVSIDYTGEGSPVVTVKVDEKDMVPVSGAAEITAANPGRAKDANQVQEVCFRGTGAVDNFVGKTMVDFVPDCWFEAEVYINGNKQPFLDPDNEELAEDPGNLSRRVFTAAGKDGHTFENFRTSNKDEADENNPLHTLDRIELTNFVEQTSLVLNYTWDGTSQIIEETPTNLVVFPVNSRTGKQTGKFQVSILTDGATALTNVAAKLYFKTYGLFSVYGETYVDGTAEEIREQKNDHIKDEVGLDDFDQLTFPTSFTTNGATYVLKSIPTNANPAVNAPALALDGSTVYVNVDLYGLSDDVVVNAYYEEGTLNGKVIKKNPDATNGAYTFFGAVAMIVSDDGENIETNYYETVQAALEAVPGDGTETEVELLADVTLASAANVPAGKTVVLDMDGHSVTGPANGFAFGVSGSLTVDGDGDVSAMVPFYVKGAGSLVVESGDFTGTRNVVLVAASADGASVTVNGGSLVAPDAIGITGKNTTVAVHGGTISATNGFAILTSGNDGKGGNAITVYGGTVEAAVTTAGYIAGGIYLANDDTLAYGSNAVMTVTGGAGIVARAGSVSVAGGTITTTGSTAGKVGDAANAIPCAAVVYDTSLSYPGFVEGAGLEITDGTFVSDVDPVVQIKKEGDGTILSVTGGWFSDQVAADYVADGYQCVRDEDNAPNADAPYTVKAAAVRLWDAETQSYVGSAQLSIADAVSVAVDNGVDVSNRVFELILPLAAETYRIASTNELFTIQTTNTDYTLNLAVETSLASSDALVYTVVGPLTETDSMVDPPVSTITWYVKADEYVAKIVNADTTVDRFKTFEVAADAAIVDGSTVVMVADDRATTYTLDDGATLSVEEGLFAVPTVVPATDSEYYISNVVSGGITTYTSMPYLLARFKNNDDSPVATVKVRANEAPVPPEAPAAAVVTEGYDAAFAGWSPAVGAISENTDYTATYTETPPSYTITYLGLNGTARLADGTPETYTIETPTFSIPAPVVTNGSVVFAGWLDNGIVDADVYVSEIAQGSKGDLELVADWRNVVTATFLDTTGQPPLFGEDGTTNFVEGAQIVWPFEEAPAKPASTAAAGWTYEFFGWATNLTDAAAGVTNALPLADPDGPTLFYAVFSSNAVEYAIDVALNGGQWGAIYLPPQTYTVTNEQISIPDPVHEYSEDYAFAGWTNALGEAVEAVIPAGSTGDKFFGATWAELKRVTFSNGRLGYDDLATNVVAGTMLAQPETPAGIAPVDTVAGFAYDFAGWALPETEDPVEWPQEITTDVNYHAVFTSNAVAYTLAFDLNSETAGWGAIYTPPQTYTVTNENISIPAPTNTPAWIFTGWRLDSLDGEAVDGAPAENPLVIAKGSTGDRVYVAVWEAAPQDPDPVDVGRLIVDGDNVEPVEIVGTTFKARFHAPQAGVTYQLVESTVVNPADWTACPAVGDPVTSTAAEQIITLEAPMGEATVKFYKIKATFPSAGN